MRFATIPLLAGLSISAPAPQAASPLHYLSVGPMFHWNFKEGGLDAFSFGIEASWWRFGQRPQERSTWFISLPDYKLPGYGVAFGIDFDKHAVRLYAEPQVGMIIAGASIGCVAELPTSRKPPRLGFQGSLWAHYLAGIDFRYRHLAGDHYQALGFYAKLPVLISGKIAYLED